MPSLAEASARPAGPPPDPAPPAGGLRSAVVWSYALTAGRIGTTTVIMFVLAKLLGPSAFGVLAMAVLVLNLAQVLLQQGLISAIVQRDQLTAEHLDAAFVALLLAGVGVGGLMAGLSPLWASLTGTPQVTTVCLALSPLVLTQALMVIPEALLRRSLRFRAIAVRTLAGAVLGGGVGITLALAGAGVWALVGQQVVAGVTQAVVLWVLCPWRPGRRPHPRAVRDLWRFSAHSANAGLAGMVGTRADQFVTGILFGPVTMGIYRLAIRLPEMFLDVTVRSLQQVALPALSRSQHDRAAFAARLAELQHLGAVAGLPLLGLLAGLSGPLVAFLGPDWDGTQLPLRLLCLLAAVNVYGVLLGPALQAIGHPGKLAALAWVRVGIGVTVFVVVGLTMTGLAPGRQATGVAIAAVGVQLVLNLAAIQVTRRTVRGVRLRLLSPTLPAAVAGAVAASAPLGLAGLGRVPDHPLAGLLLCAGLSGLAAAAVLWVGDHRVRTLVRRRLPGLPLTWPRPGGRHRA